MTDVLGILGMLVFIACVIALAAAVTYLVVRLSPVRDTAKPRSQEP